VPEAPALVVGAHQPGHGLLAQETLQGLEGQRRPGVDVETVVGRADPGMTADRGEVAVRPVGDSPALVAPQPQAEDISQPSQDFPGFPDIPAGETATAGRPFTLDLMGDVPDAHVIPFTLIATASEGSWTGYFDLTAQAPVLAVAGLQVMDQGYGNGNGGANAGEIFHLVTGIANSGHSAADDLTSTLVCTDPHVVIHQADGHCATIAVGEESWFSAFQVELLAECPEPSNLDFRLEITSGNLPKLGNATFAVQLDDPGMGCLLTPGGTITALVISGTPAATPSPAFGCFPPGGNGVLMVGPFLTLSPAVTDEGGNNNQLLASEEYFQIIDRRDTEIT